MVIAKPFEQRKGFGMFRNIAFMVVSLMLWLTLILAGGIAAALYLPRPIAPTEDFSAFEAALKEKVEAQINNGNTVSTALLLLQDGEIASETYYGFADRERDIPVTGETIYQMASVSKAVTAWLVMSLVEQGEIDLDVPVSDYLTRWELPEGNFDNDEVTVRRLLSHTAGLTDGFGYPGYAPDEPLPTLEESLNGTMSFNGEMVSVAVGHKPGDRWQYSGGGYTILQLLIEEVSGESFADYAEQVLFEPLGMTDATFVWDEGLTDRLAVSYDLGGAPAPHYRFTEAAAASLYATPYDMATFALAAAPGSDGEPAGRGVLDPSTLRLMFSPQEGAELLGMRWGLGYTVHQPITGSGQPVEHDGSNRPAINHTLVIDPETGDGLLLMASGGESSDLRSMAACEWLTWHTGGVTPYCAPVYHIPNVIPIVLGVGGVGLLLIVAASFLALQRNQRLASSKPSA